MTGNRVNRKVVIGSSISLNVRQRAKGIKVYKSKGDPQACLPRLHILMSAKVKINCFIKVYCLPLTFIATWLSLLKEHYLGNTPAVKLERWMKKVFTITNCSDMKECVPLKVIVKYLFAKGKNVHTLLTIYYFLFFCSNCFYKLDNKICFYPFLLESTPCSFLGLQRAFFISGPDHAII